MENGQEQQPTNDDALEEAQQQLVTARDAADHAEDAVQQAQDNSRPSQDVDTLRTKLEKGNAENRKLKDEIGQRRVTVKEVEEKNEKLRKVAQLLGLEPDDDDPEALVKRAQQEAAERDELQSQLNPLQENDHLRGLAKKAGCSPR